MDVVDAELVIGIVGRIGVETSEVCSWVEGTLHALHYKSYTIKIIDFLKTKEFDFELDESSLEERYKT